jgi:hypothetical protein
LSWKQPSRIFRASYDARPCRAIMAALAVQRMLNRGRPP